MSTNQTIFSLFERVARYYGDESPEELILGLADETMNDTIWDLLSANIGSDLNNARNFRAFYTAVQYCIEYCNGDIFHRLLETYCDKTNINCILLMPSGNDFLEYLISFGVGSTEYIDNYCNMIHDLLSHDFIPLEKHYKYLEQFNRKTYKTSLLTMFANWSISDDRVSNIEKIRNVLDLFKEREESVDAPQEEEQVMSL